MMFSTCFETEGSSAGRRFYVQLWYVMLHVHRYKTAHTEACQIYYTTPVRTTVFLKMNPRDRNM